MNKTELVAHVAEVADLSKTDAAKAVEATFEVITNTLKTGDEVRLIGFGNFLVSDRPASTRRNPATGKPMDIPATTVPKFKAGKSLKDAVKEGNKGGSKKKKAA